ncbi:PAS domain S-box protein [Methylobacterium brachiatum]|jgi:PAS domain S-box-containing protein|uniref:PAS domain S-box protein n=1 Tax=Methylobacterium brachiatum TaxID=269660 RepID=UPI002449AC82|nr:PAS domain S-box protein [Methylobacterium brachiatum]MDH2310829.1 PAS domain S-box protein [Methylobacterium brachiatum]
MSIEDLRGEVERLRRRESELLAEIARLRAGQEPHAPSTTSEAGVGTLRPDLLFTAADKTRMAMIVTDPNLPDNPIVFANRAFLELSGYAAEELIGRNCRFLQGPETDPAHVARIRDAIAARRDVVVELLNYRRDGSPFVNELYVSPVFGPHGELLFFFGSQLDLTRFREQEGNAVRRGASFRSLLEDGEAGFCIIEMRFDGEGRAEDYRFVEVNAAFERQSGLANAEGRWMRELEPELERHWFDTYGEVARTGRDARFRGAASRLGRVFDVHAVRIGSQAQNRVAVLFEDATVRQEGEERREARDRDNLVERDLVWRTSRDLLVVCGLDGSIRAVGPAWTETLGWPAGSLVGVRIDSLVHADDKEAASRAFEMLRAGLPLSDLDIRFRTADGGHRWMSWNAIPQGDRFHATGRDVTERRALEEQLRQSQKMEAVGQLTGGVAHDFNNLLTVIKSSTDLLKRPSLSEERRSRYVDAISDTVDRAAKLTSQLLSFARRQALRPTVFDAAQSVAAIADMVRTLTGARIRVETDTDTGQDADGERLPCHVDADPSQFDTALVNLVVNARDAMQGEGRLRIAVRRAARIPTLRSHPAVPGDFVAVSVSDTGGGIEPDLLERIFEPFFTTKGVGHGTGLGLSQVFGFAKQSGGDVAVDSEVGAGTTFTLFLPRSADGSAREPARDDPGPLPEGHGTPVLVVEDNVEVGAFATQALGELGYQAVWVKDAQAALAEIEASGQRFEVVFSDVVMPGMNGVDLAREIRRRWPYLPVVLTSGYSHVLAFEGTDGFPLLGKPYSVADLSRALRKALRERLALTFG